MKTTISASRGVVTERDGDGLVVEGPLVVEGAIRVEGSVSLAGVLVTAAAATVSSAYTFVSTAGNCVLTLPNALTVDQQEFKVKKLNSDAHSLTVTAVAGQKIDDGSDSLVIAAAYTSLTLYAFQGAWYVF